MKTIHRSSDSNSSKSILKKHLYAIVLVSTVIVLGGIVALSIVLSKRGDEQVVAPPPPSQTFVMPLDDIEIAQEASLTKLVYNPSLREWRTVNGTIFSAVADTQIKAVADGKVVLVEDTLLQGTVISVDHGEGVVSTYLSLQDNPEVEVGQEVTAGQVLGHASNRLKQYQHYDNQLYLEMRQAGKLIDPMTILPYNV